MQLEQRRLDIGERLKRARQSAKLSQEYVAAQFDKTRQAIAAWESGRGSPSAPQLAALCIMYGCSSDGLLFGNDKVEADAAGYMDSQLDRLDPAVRDRLRLLWKMLGRASEKA